MKRRMPVSFVGNRLLADVTQFVRDYLTPAALNDITKTGPRDDAKLAAIKLEWWPRSDWNRWPPSLESAPDELCAADTETYAVFRKRLQDLYDFTINRGGNVQPDLVGLPVTSKQIDASRARVMGMMRINVRSR